MEKFGRSGTPKTPTVMLDEQAGIIEIKGRSILEETLAFYEPILEWVNEYLKNPKDTVINIDLEYFNSTSARMLLKLFQNLLEIKKSGFTLTVNWFYAKEDENIRESGSDFASLVKIKFNLVEKP